ncbi:MAG: carboxypeptidase-like regulatory domain-containing protein, partial [Bacteroidales bacterium]|nr:carboxypeptidase-like regulatory domain-containing protein [Bacteroidales bacterium]
MQRFFILSFLLFFGGFVSSQETVPVSGWVRNAETGEPLPYAQIALAGTTLGTVTNEDGFFRLNLPSRQSVISASLRDAGLPDAGYRNAGLPDSLVVMFLGFRTQRVAVDQLKGKAGEIRMVPVSLDLREVEIIALTPQEVLRRAFDSIPVNYGQDSVILTAFIRTQKTVNKKLAEYTEAIVEDLKTGYTACSPRESGIRHQVSNIPKLDKGRVTSDTNLVNLLGEVGANARCLGCNFVRDVAEFPYETVLDERDQKHYILTMKEQVNPEGGKIYRIR